jgi:hypothetical protein
MIEISFPGVYLTEVAFAAKTIEGVATSTADLSETSEHDRFIPSPSAGTPEWTDANQSDPGVTFPELFAWITEALSYRDAQNFEHLVRHAALGSGVVSGLAADGHRGEGLNVTPGAALDPAGRPVQTHLVSARLVPDRDP